MKKLAVDLKRSGRGAHSFVVLHILPLLVAALALAWAHSARAIPYASGITNNAGTVSFVLNESADEVKVTLNPGGTILTLGALAKGTHNFNLGAATSFEIEVRKITTPGWTLISSDANTLLQFNSPRGVAVNFNTNTPTFGRIYVANSSAGSTTSGRPVGDGLYILNADQSDALGLGNSVSTGGLLFTSGAQQASNPWRIEVGPDNFLYIADFSTNTGTIYRTDADVSAASGVNIFQHYGITNQSVHTDFSSSPIVSGSLDAGNLQVWAIDGRFPGSGNFNRLFRWDINAGPLPHGDPPAPLANPLITSNPDITTDLDRGPDGKFYMMQNRSDGIQTGVVVVDSAGTTVLWTSLAESRSISNNPTGRDILRVSRAIDVSPDGTKLAVIRDDLQTWMIPLINGIPDLTNREVVVTYSGAPTTLGRDVCFDPVGNLYALSSGNQLLRIFSPGGASIATTRSDGTFNVTYPQIPLVRVLANTSLTAESGLGPGEFLLQRSGSVSEALTVDYQLSGTASNGADYTTLPTSATFLAGESNVTVSVAAIDDSEAELSELVVLTLVAGTNYAPVATNNTATVSIRDNEYPNVLTVTALDANSFERFTNDVFTFRVTRYGDPNVEAYANFVFLGTATEGVDYNAISFDVFFGPGVVNIDVPLSPKDDALVEGAETVLVELTGGFDWVAGSPSNAVMEIRDDEYVPAPVLFADNFETNSSANWLVRFGANNGIYDATNIFAYDYVTAGVPLAPHSAPGGGKGLYVAVNKFNTNQLGSAGINLFPAGQNFSGDFTLRFDMYLSFGTAGTTEHALAGLNHSTLLTNRVTQSADAGESTRGGDGVWVAIETDGSNNRDYTAYTTTNQANVPAILASRTATSLTNLITSPPYTFPGSPGVVSTSLTKEWSTVELGQSANVITLKVNAATVFSFTNTSGFTNGAVMLGMNDQFDSIGSLVNYVIFDNVEVVGSGTAPVITDISFPAVGQVAIDFTSPSGGQPADFHLQSTPTLTPPVWVDDTNATLTATGNGLRATTTRAGDSTFYRIRR